MLKSLFLFFLILSPSLSHYQYVCFLGRGQPESPVLVGLEQAQSDHQSREAVLPPEPQAVRVGHFHHVEQDWRQREDRGGRCPEQWRTGKL